MKRKKILTFLAVFSIFGFLVAGCDDNMPEVKEIGVDSVTLSEGLSSGITLEVGEETDISWKVTLTPADATDRAENYYSSNPEVATVNAKGILSANSPGTSDITIAVGGKSADFTLTVVAKPEIPFTKVELSITDKELYVGVPFDLGAMVVTEPLTGATDVLLYSSSDESVATISEAGILTGVGFGKTTVTVTSKLDPTLTDQLEVDVNVNEYDRTGWSMTTSHSLPISEGNPEGNSLTAAIDGNHATNLSIVRPNKSYAGVSVSIGETISFVVDMQESRTVNYFRIRHRNTTQAFIRWYGFDTIEGSQDGTNFDVINNDVVLTDAGVAGQQDSPEIQLTESTYRYLKFTAKETRCFNGNSHSSQGSTVQIQELYIGQRVTNP